MDSDDEFVPLLGFEKEELTPTFNLVKENSSRDADDTENFASVKRGPGRPRKVRTGKQGRPAKAYQTATNKQNPVLTKTLENLDAESANISSRGDEEDELSPDSCIAMNAVEFQYSSALQGPNRNNWLDAIYDEIKSFVNNNTWEIINRPQGSKVIGCRTVLCDKYDPDGTLSRRKARVVARRFTQKLGVDVVDTFASVARRTKSHRVQ